MENSKYKATIGLEIHAELKTKSKMFCACKNNPDEEKPNINICPICTGQPGTLPVINKQAVKNVLKLGVALGAKLADFTEWDRKNYFYPDIPKGYQISQYKYPLITGGVLKGINITRIHLEEDTAKSSHDQGEFSLVDFNRAGVPLMELVTEPELHSGKETADFARELQLVLQYLGISDANMEKGEMRIEANISISDTDKLGTKVEVKNINSFRAVERAVAYEIERHIQVLESGGKIVQETRGWNEDKQITFSQRLKEDSHDYRYFPDPDLPKMKISEITEFSIDSLKRELPELPAQKRERYIKDYGMKEVDAEVFITDEKLRDFFDKVAPEADSLSEQSKKSFVNFITNDLIGLLKKSETNKIPSIENFRDLIGLYNREEINSRVAKDLLAFMVLEDKSPTLLMEEHGLQQKNDIGELEKIAQQIISDNTKVVADYKAGKEVALMSLVGQGMKATKGSANPQVLKEVFLKLLVK